MVFLYFFHLIVFRQGDIGCYWYAVLSGTLDVYVSSSGKFEVVFRMFQHREPGNLTGHALYPSKRKLFQFVVNLVPVTKITTEMYRRASLL